MEVPKEKLMLLNNLNILVQHYQRACLTIQAELREEVMKCTGVDIDTGNYVLNIEKGTLDVATE
jgi:hypothetical protein